MNIVVEFTVSDSGAVISFLALSAFAFVVNTLLMFISFRDNILQPGWRYVTRNQNEITREYNFGENDSTVG